MSVSIYAICAITYKIKINLLEMKYKYYEHPEDIK